MTRLSPKDKPTLLPCPFCGNTDLGFGTVQAANMSWGRVDCFVCSAHIGERTEEAAAERWNTRTASPITSDADALKAAYIEGMVMGVSRGSVDAASADDAWKASRACENATAQPDTELVGAANAQIDENEQAMIEERKEQYGSAFKQEQLVAIQGLHRQQRNGVKIVAALLLERGEPK